MCKNLDNMIKIGQEEYCKAGFRIVQSCYDKKCIRCIEHRNK